MNAVTMEVVISSMYESWSANVEHTICESIVLIECRHCLATS